MCAACALRVRCVCDIHALHPRGPDAYTLPAEGWAASVIEVTSAVAQEVLEEVGLAVAATLGRERLVHVRHHREVRPPRLLGLILLRQQLVNNT